MTDRKTEEATDSATPSEFDTAFEEFADGTSDPDDATPADETNEEENEDGAQATDQDDDTDDQEPAPDQSDENSDEDLDDPFADAPDHIREAIKAIQEERDAFRHKHASDRGRIAAMQRRLTELQNQVEQSGKPDTKAGNGGKDTSKTTSQADTDDAFRQFREEYPEIAEPITAYVARLESQLQQQGQQFATLSQQTQIDRLQNAHPDWLGVARSDEFAAWISEQSQDVQQAYQRNAKQIVNGAEAAAVISRFKAANNIGNTETASGNGAGSQDQQRPKTTTAKRQAQLRSAHGARGRGPGTASGPPDDFDKAFDYYASQG